MIPHRDELQALAIEAWGEPNRTLSSRTELRFGSNGSKSLKLADAVWFDHEAGAGGGFRELHKLARGTFPANGADEAPDFATQARNLFRLKPVGWWDYHDEHGAVVARAVRFEPKTFRQCRPDGAGWKWSVTGLRIPLYRLPELLSAPADATVYVTEGEKHADALRAWGLVATTNIGGAKKFRDHHAATLAGRNVVVLPDNDEPGRNHARLVVRLLHAAGAHVRTLELPGLPEKGDVIDWIAAGGTADTLAELVSAAQTRADTQEPVADEDDDEAAQAEIQRLARLPLLKYGLQRKAAAKALNIGAALLDKLVNAERGASPSAMQGEALEFLDPEPWPQPVDGFELVYDIRDLLQRHIVLPPGAGWVVAVWCLHTFLLGITEHTPRLAVVSPERGCGKTTLLDLLGRLVARPLLAANLTPAATFRVIARHRPSLLIDEADTFLRDNEELRGVLNAGHRYDGFVLRTVGEDMEPRRFSVFGAVAIALIGSLPGTLADRSIMVRMRRASVADQTEPIRKATHARAVELMRKAQHWAEEHRDKLNDAEPMLPPRMWNRVADNWRPLFAIAEAAGGQMPAKLAEAAETLIAQGAADPQSLGVMLLQDVRMAFEARGEGDSLPSAELVRDLVALDERPWGAFGKGDKPLSPRRLAELLRPFGVMPSTRRDGQATSKGYRRDQFEDAWERYL